MEVLVSPNDGPQLSIEDLELDDSPVENQNDSPFSSGLHHDSMSILNDTKSANKTITRLKSGSSTSPDIDKLIDRRFACYGVSPRLSRKAPDLDCHSTTASSFNKTTQPTNLDCSSFTDKDGNDNAETKPLRHKSK